MANKKLVVEISSKGYLKVSGEVGALADKVEKVNTGQKKTSKSNAEYVKNLKGAGQATNNQTKAFSKLAQGMGGIVPIYAGIAANVFALTAAFGALERAASFDILTRSAEKFSASVGVSLQKTAKDIKELAFNMVSIEDTLKQVSIGIAAGFDTTTIKDLAKAARNASIALGRDMKDSMDRIFRGALKAEPELLDELGIILRLQPATREYAKELGKTAGELTTFQKQQAVVNAVLKQADEKFRDVDTDEFINKYSVLAATFNDLSKNAWNFISVPLGGFVEFFGNNVASLTALLGLFTVLVVSKTIPAIKVWGATIVASSAEAALAAKSSFSSFNKTQREYVKNLEKTKKSTVKANKDLGKEIQAFASGGVTKGQRELFALKPGSTEQFKKYTDVVKGQFRKLEKQQTVFGKSGEKFTNSIKKNYAEAQAELIKAGITGRTTGKAFENSFQRITASAKVSGLAVKAFATTVKSASISGFVAGWTLSFTGLKAAILSTAAAGGVLTTTFYSIGAAAGFLLAAAPYIFVIVIALQALMSLLKPLTDVLGLTSKESRNFSGALDEVESALDANASATKYYNDVLANSERNIANVTKQLDHQRNRLSELESATVKLLSHKISSSFLDFFGVGKLAEARDRIEGLFKATVSMNKETEDALFKSQKAAKLFGENIQGMDEEHLQRMLVLILNAQTEGSLAVAEASAELKKQVTVFDEMNTSVSKLLQDKKLSAVDSAIVKISLALETLDKNKEFVQELASNLDDLTLAALNLSIPEKTKISYDELVSALSKYRDVLISSSKNIKIQENELASLDRQQKGYEQSLAGELNILNAKIVAQKEIGNQEQIIKKKAVNNLIEQSKIRKLTEEEQNALTQSLQQQQELEIKNKGKINKLSDDITVAVLKYTEAEYNGLYALNEKLKLAKEGRNVDEANLAIQILIAEATGADEAAITAKIATLRLEHNLRSSIKALAIETALSDQAASLAASNKIAALKRPGLFTPGNKLEADKLGAKEDYIQARKGVEKQIVNIGPIDNDEKKAAYMEAYAVIIELEKKFQQDISTIEQEASERRRDKMLGDLASTAGSISSILAQSSKNQVEKINRRYNAEADRIREQADLVKEQEKSKLITKEQANRQLIGIEKQLENVEKKREAAANGKAKKAFELSQNLARAEVIINTAVAAMAAAKVEGSFFGIPGAAAAVAAVTALGLKQLHVINSQSFNSGGSIDTNVGATSKSPGASPVPPNVTTNRGTTFIRVEGRKGVVYDTDTMDDLLNRIEEAVTRGDRIIIDKNSRNGLELSGVA